MRTSCITAKSLALAVLACALGCDRVSRAIVGHDAGMTEDPIPHVGCIPPPPCDDKFVPHAGADFELHPARSSCPSLRACSATVSSDEDAGASANEPSRECRVISETRALTAAAWSVAHCTRLRIDNTASRPPARTELEEITWDAGDVSIATRTPWLLELHGGSLRHTLIELAGPVTLRLVRPVELDDVRVTGIVSDAGAPQLELHEVDSATLAVGDADEPFHGTVHITRAMLAQSQLVADDLVLESVTFKDVIVKTHDLTARDANISQVTLAFDDALFSASTLFDVLVTDCGSLKLLEASVQNTRIAACRNPPTRVYYTDLVRAVVDGEIESDRSEWHRCIFGLHAPTNIVAWASSIAASDFCAHARTLRGGADTVVNCSACEQGRDHVPDPCAIPSMGDGAPLSLASNFCPALRTARDCSDPLPIRTHPDPDPNSFP